MDEIQKDLAALPATANYNGCTAPALKDIMEDMMQQQQHLTGKVIGLNSPLMRRSEAFKPELTKLKECVEALMKCFGPKCNGMHLELMGEVSLEAPIRLMVDDLKLDQTLINTMTLNHSVAALILQLAINIVIDSPFIIIDGLDDFIEPRLAEYVIFQFAYALYFSSNLL